MELTNVRPVLIFKGCTDLIKVFKDFSVTGVILLIASFVLPFFFQSLAQYQTLLFIFAVLLVAPYFLLSFFSTRLHLKGIDKNKAVSIHLVGFTLTGAFLYYEKALSTFQANREHYSKELKDNILYNILLYVILAERPYPDNIIKDWSEAYDISPAEFTRNLLEIDEDLFFRAISPSLNFGSIPLLWPYLSQLDEEYQNKFLAEITHQIKSLDNYHPSLKRVFIDELFLVSESLIKVAETNPDYQPIIELLLNYQPPELPSGKIDLIKKTTFESGRILTAKREARNFSLEGEESKETDEIDDFTESELIESSSE